jgi:hypothetical protein
VWLEGLGKLKKKIYELIGNGTCDFQTCSVAPQQKSFGVFHRTGINFLPSKPAYTFIVMSGVSRPIISFQIHCSSRAILNHSVIFGVAECHGVLAVTPAYYVCDFPQHLRKYSLIILT